MRGHAGTMTSGVTVKDECMKVFEEMKLGHKWKYVIFKISEDKKEIVVEQTSADDTYETFQEQLKAGGHCRYGVFDVQMNAPPIIKEKLAFFHWNPDTCNIKEKMLYASSLKELKMKLKGIQTDIQAKDDDDLSLANVHEKCSDRYA
ncbi:uncharacterized protein LOC132561783 isoform X1 [Ylistrum balloti]|uniref:uncharacterized protein LOC132561783 isoform X1 n=2 Tax=Ylistrum balloti TaxID=509963 RepID=UPI002905A410|nr:uncharacterized protein LOC132561783 isoform X1 [Ylistrum balloti]